MTGVGPGARVDRGLAVAAAEALPATIEGDYLTVLKGLPVLVQTSGLAATAAYLLSRAGAPPADGSEDKGKRYREAATALLADAAEFVGLAGDGAPVPLLDAVSRLDESRYRIAERRARAFAVWLARLGAARRAQETT